MELYKHIKVIFVYMVVYTLGLCIKNVQCVVERHLLKHFWKLISESVNILATFFRNQLIVQFSIKVNLGRGVLYI